MAELSKDVLEEIVALVTANVLVELKKHETAHFAGEIRLPLTSVTALGSDVSWAPWVVALPPGVKKLTR